MAPKKTIAVLVTTLSLFAGDPPRTWAQNESATTSAAVKVPKKRRKSPRPRATPPDAQSPAIGSAALAAPVGSSLPQPEVVGPPTAKISMEAALGAPPPPAAGAPAAPLRAEGPSLDETLSWVVGKLKNLNTDSSRRIGENVSQGNRKILAISHKNCQLVVHTTDHLDGVPDSNPNWWSSSFDLAKQDPLSIHCDQNKGQTASDGTFVAYVNPMWIIAALDLQFNDRELGTRVASALKHAAELCGGKVEPF